MLMNKGMISYNQSRLSVIFNKIVMAFIDVFCHPICINACLHYSYGRLMHRNWGDDINISNFRNTII